MRKSSGSHIVRCGIPCRFPGGDSLLFALRCSFPSPDSETELPCCTKSPMAPVPTNFACWLQHPARARVHPHGADRAKIVIGPADDCGVSVSGKRDGLALRCGAYSAGAHHFCLLGPNSIRTREHPCGASNAIAIRPTDDGGISVSGKGNGNALYCTAYGVCAGQFRGLLEELRMCRRRHKAAYQHDSEHKPMTLVFEFHLIFLPYLGLWARRGLNA
jgi:hypothetical protein